MRGEIHKLYRRFYPGEQGWPNEVAGLEAVFVKEAVAKALDVFAAAVPNLFNTNNDNPHINVVHGIHPSVSNIDANDLKPEDVAKIEKYIWCRVSMQLGDHHQIPIANLEALLRNPTTGLVNAELI